MAISMYPRKSRTLVPPKSKAKALPNSRRHFRRRQERWGAPFTHSVELQILIEELTHPKYFTFAQLARLDAESEYAAMWDNEDFELTGLLDG